MIIVFGSIYRDFRFKAETLPAPGETMPAESYTLATGGKAANQALAASRFGRRVALVGMVGDDGIGMNILNNLRRMGVMTSGVAKSEDKPTGCAVIVRDAKGTSQSVVARGANADISAEQVPAEILGAGNFVLMQADTPATENIALAANAKEHGAKTLLNFSPAEHYDPAIMKDIDYLVMNENEARHLARHLKLNDKESEEKLSEAFAQKFGLTCLITRAKRGSVAFTKNSEAIAVKAAKVERIADTIGAGDAYCGTLAACLYSGEELETAMKKASVAASLSCQDEGAHDSYVYQSDIEDYLKNTDI